MPVPAECPGGYAGLAVAGGRDYCRLALVDLYGGYPDRTFHLYLLFRIQGIDPGFIRTPDYDAGRRAVPRIGRHSEEQGQHNCQDNYGDVQGLKEFFLHKAMVLTFFIILNNIDQ